MSKTFSYAHSSFRLVGITRSVLVHTLPLETYLLRVETFTLSLSGLIKINVVLGGNTNVSSVQLSLSFDGATPYGA